MFFCGYESRKIIEDEEIKNDVVSKYPYRKWVDENILPLSKIPTQEIEHPKKKHLVKQD